MSEPQVNKTSPISGVPKPTPPTTPPPVSAMPNLSTATPIPAAQPSPVSSQQPIIQSTTAPAQPAQAHKAPTSTPTINLNPKNNSPSSHTGAAVTASPTTQNQFLFDSSKNTPKSAQRTDHFAEQNQRRAEKTKKNAALRKEILKFSSIALAALATIVLISGIAMYIVHKITHPDPEPIISQEEVIELSKPNSEVGVEIGNQAQEIITNGGSAEEVEQFYDDHLKEIEQSNNSAETINQASNNLLLLQLSTFANNFDYGRVIQVSKDINVDILSDEQKLILYGLLQNAYSFTGNAEQANYYFELSNSLSRNNNAIYVNYGS